MSTLRRWPRYDRSKPGNVWLAIEDVREAIDALVTADEVAAAVTERLRKEHTMVLGLGGKIAASLIGVATLATAIHSWFG